MNDKKRKHEMQWLAKNLGMNYHTLKGRVLGLGIEIVKNYGEKAFVMISSQQIEYIKIPPEERKKNTREQLEEMFNFADMAFSGRNFPSNGIGLEEIKGNKKINRIRM